MASTGHPSWSNYANPPPQECIYQTSQIGSPESPTTSTCDVGGLGSNGRKTTVAVDNPNVEELPYNSNAQALSYRPNPQELSYKSNVEASPYNPSPGSPVADRQHTTETVQHYEMQTQPNAEKLYTPKKSAKEIRLEKIAEAKVQKLMGQSGQVKLVDYSTAAGNTNVETSPHNPSPASPVADRQHTTETVQHYEMQTQPNAEKLYTPKKSAKEIRLEKIAEAKVQKLMGQSGQVCGGIETGSHHKVTESKASSNLTQSKNQLATSTRVAKVEYATLDSFKADSFKSQLDLDREKFAQKNALALLKTSTKFC